MPWRFKWHDEERDARVTARDAEARANEISLVQKVLELDRSRHDLDRVTEEALRELRGGARHV